MLWKEMDFVMSSQAAASLFTILPATAPSAVWPPRLALIAETLDLEDVTQMWSTATH